MPSLFGIIQDYKKDLFLFPLVTGILVAMTLYLYFKRPKKEKYYPPLFAIVLGFLILLIAGKTLRNEHGLFWLWLGSCLFLGGWVALGAAWIAVLAASLKDGKKKTKPSKRAPKPKNKTGSNES